MLKFVLFLKIFLPILIYQFVNYSASFVGYNHDWAVQYHELVYINCNQQPMESFILLTGIVSGHGSHHSHHRDAKEVHWLFEQSTYLAGLSFGLAYMVVFLAPPVLKSYRARSLPAAAVLLSFGTSINIPVFLVLVCLRFSWFDQTYLAYLMLRLLPLTVFVTILWYMEPWFSRALRRRSRARNF